MEKEIKLSPKLFKALSSDTRLKIIKALESRRMTTTELSKKLNISKSTVHEHLSKLSEVDLVNKTDENNKWVYYELTKRGNEILNPQQKTKIIFFVTSIIATTIGGLLEIYRSFNTFYLNKMSQISPEAGKIGEETGRTMVTFSWTHFIIGAILLLITAYLIYKLKKY